MAVRAPTHLGYCFQERPWFSPSQAVRKFEVFVQPLFERQSPTISTQCSIPLPGKPPLASRKTYAARTVTGQRWKIAPRSAHRMARWPGARPESISPWYRPKSLSDFGAPYCTINSRPARTLASCAAAGRAASIARSHSARNCQSPDAEADRASSSRGRITSANRPSFQRAHTVEEKESGEKVRHRRLVQPGWQSPTARSNSMRASFVAKVLEPLVPLIDCANIPSDAPF